MGKKKKNREPGRDLVKTEGVPNYLEAYVEDDTSLDAMKEYRVLQRLKVVQNTSRSDLTDKFNFGDIIMSPGNILVGAVNQKAKVTEDPVPFVPVFFFVEFCKWSDLEDTEASTILGRTFDPANEIARRARDPKTRFEKYEDGKYVARYVEHLNFAGFIYQPHKLAGEACVQTFSRGEFSRGRNFISGVTMRKVPLWAQIWLFTVGFREQSASRKWWGIDYSPPEDRSTIEEGEVEFFKAAHEEMKDLYEKQRLIVDHEDSKSEEDPDRESDF